MPTTPPTPNLPDPIGQLLSAALTAIADTTGLARATITTTLLTQPTTPTLIADTHPDGPTLTDTHTLPSRHHATATLATTGLPPDPHTITHICTQLSSTLDLFHLAHLWHTTNLLLTAHIAGTGTRAALVDKLRRHSGATAIGVYHQQPDGTYQPAVTTATGPLTGPLTTRTGPRPPNPQRGTWLTLTDHNHPTILALTQNGATSAYLHPFTTAVAGGYTLALYPQTPTLQPLIEQLIGTATAAYAGTVEHAAAADAARTNVQAAAEAVSEQRRRRRTLAHELTGPAAALQHQLTTARNRTADPALRQQLTTAAQVAATLTHLPDVLDAVERSAPTRITRPAHTTTATDLAAHLAAIEPGTRIENRCGDQQFTINRHLTLLAARNLIRNAHQHGQPPVTLTLEHAPGQLHITVTDHGPGLANPELAYQPGYSTTGSSGVGLHLTAEIADTVGGRLHYHHGGQTTRFHLELPATS